MLQRVVLLQSVFRGLKIHQLIILEYNEALEVIQVVFRQEIMFIMEQEALKLIAVYLQVLTITTELGAGIKQEIFGV